MTRPVPADSVPVMLSVVKVLGPSLTVAQQGAMRDVTGVSRGARQPVTWRCASADYAPAPRHRLEPDVGSECVDAAARPHTQTGQLGWTDTATFLTEEGLLHDAIFQ